MRIVITHLPTYLPSMVNIQYFVFELHPFPCLANQRASSVAMATRSKLCVNFESSRHKLSGDINTHG